MRYGYVFPLDQDQLYNLYVVMRKTAQEIADEVGCSQCTVLNYLKKYNIPVRTSKESNWGDLDDGFSLENIDVIIGSLLGDAWITNPKGERLPCFAKQNNHYSHVFYVAKKIFSINSEERIVDRFRVCEETGEIRHSHVLYSLGYESIKDLSSEWYKFIDGKRIKQVPKFKKMTPEIAFHWFLDDGHAEYVHESKKQVGISLASMSFSREENEFLCEQFVKAGVDAYVALCNSGTGFFIRISTAHARDFYDFIGPCPEELVDDMGYKWLEASKPLTRRSYYPLLENREWLENEYIVKKRSIASIAREVGCSDSTVRASFCRLGILLRESWSFPNTLEKNPQLNDKAFLEKLYFDEYLTLIEIGKIIGCSSSTIQRAFIKLGIKLIQRRPRTKERYMRLHGLSDASC